MTKRSLREEMPAVTAFIDSLREAFGRDMIDKQIRDGIRGEPVFWASENGIEIGTRVNPDVPMPTYGKQSAERGGEE